MKVENPNAVNFPLDTAEALRRYMWQRPVATIEEIHAYIAGTGTMDDETLATLCRAAGCDLVHDEKGLAHEDDIPGSGE